MTRNHAEGFDLQPRTVWLALSFLAAIAWLWIANDGRYHWDGLSYLRLAARTPISTLLSPAFVEHHPFQSSRLFHIAILHPAFSLLDPGASSLRAVGWLDVGLLLAAGWVGAMLIRSLMGLSSVMVPGLVAVSFAPVFPWLAFKAMPETPGLLFLSIAMLSLIRFLQGRTWAWLALTVISVVAVTFTRNQLAFTLAALVVSLLAFGGYGFSLPRLLIGGAAVALLSMALFACILLILDLSLDRYLSTARNVMSERASLARRLFALGLAVGPLLAAVPLALLNPDRRAAIFMLLWFGLSLLPIYVLIGDIEARYLVGSLVPLMGLAALAGEAIFTRAGFGRAGTWAIAAMAALVLAASARSAQPLLQHEVVESELAQVMDELDRRYGPGRYTVVAPWTTEFSFLQVVYPGHHVVSGLVQAPDPSRPRDLSDPLNQPLKSIADLEKEPQPWLYLGPIREFHSAAVRSLIASIPLPLSREKPDFGAGRVVNAEPRYQYRASWIHDDPHLIRIHVLDHGHYRVEEIRLRTDTGDDHPGARRRQEMTGTRTPRNDEGAASERPRP